MRKVGWTSVLVELKGAEPSSILNRLAGAGLAFSRAESGEDGLRLTVKQRSLRRLMDVSREEGWACDILSRGLIAGTESRLRRRALLLLCLLPLFVLLWGSSLYVWEIRVVGNEKITAGEILRNLEELGVGIGTFRPGIDNTRIAEEMLLRIPELSFLSCNSFGSSMVVLVREESGAPEKASPGKAADLVAARGGVVHAVTVLSGEARVRRGQMVEKGDPLVLSRRVDLQGESREEGAVALVEAWTYYEITAVTPLTALKKEYTGEVLRDESLYLFGKHINFFKMSGNLPMNCDKITETRPLCLPGGTVLPFALGKSLAFPYTVEEEALDPQAARRYLELRLKERLEGSIKGSIMSQSTLAEERDGMLTVTLRAVCLENIAVPGESLNTE